MKYPISLTLVRHGESEWNRDDRFTGWADVDLTDLGRQQMRGAAAVLRDAGVPVDIAFTSVLRRCIRSQWIVLEAMERMWVPQRLDWRLNERHYGALTGQLKSEVILAYGEAAVQRWRRSFGERPPSSDAVAGRYVSLDARYAALAAEQIPKAESLADTVRRVGVIWSDEIAPLLMRESNALVVAHGNSLRALIKRIEGLTDQEVVHLEVANGDPIVYEFDPSGRLLNKRIFNLPRRRSSEIL